MLKKKHNNALNTPQPKKAGKPNVEEDDSQLSNEIVQDKKEVKLTVSIPKPLSPISGGGVELNSGSNSNSSSSSSSSNETNKLRKERNTDKSLNNTNPSPEKDNSPSNNNSPSPSSKIFNIGQKVEVYYERGGEGKWYKATVIENQRSKNSIKVLYDEVGSQVINSDQYNNVRVSLSDVGEESGVKPKRKRVEPQRFVDEPAEKKEKPAFQKNFRANNGIDDDDDDTHNEEKDDVNNNERSNDDDNESLDYDGGNFRRFAPADDGNKGEGKHPCQEVGCTWNPKGSRPNLLKKHEATAHGIDVIWHECLEDECGKRFRSKNGLNKHYESFHKMTNPKKAVNLLKECPTEGCDFKSKNSNQLKNHENQVHGLIPWLYCPENGCKYSTNAENRKAFKNHAWLIHGQTKYGGKYHECGICSVKKKTKNLFENTPFKIPQH